LHKKSNNMQIKYAKKRKISLVEKAYTALKEQIVSLQIPPGSKIEESHLIERLKIGRTPIREALKILISEGLVISYGSNATYVKDLSMKSAKDLLSLIHHMGSLIFDLINPEDDFSEIVSQLEEIYARMDEAITHERMYDFANLNAEFHKTLARAADNQYLDTILERMYSEEIRLGYLLSLVKVNKKIKSYYYEILQIQHLKLIKLLVKRDFNSLKQIYKEHLTTGEQRLVFYFSQE